MIVEGIRGDAENFPAGMRVLAVDDDAICLKLLDTLLRKCQYNVTTTNQAMIALNMIRENKDRFDLVICDVHMPDVDGFKLLELIGLEMDLPVIMLSANSDPELVMKGVSHGACDYLVKPVRLEELRNIWQHVIRRKKFDSKNQNRPSDQVKTHQARGEGHVPPLAGNSNQNGKSNRKRKDDEDEHEDTGNNHEDPGTQKKPRVVWTPELHKEFVAAVHQLGIQKAVPKRILDTMNVKGLTRENVASHLQKFRLYLKRISNQQAHMGAAAGVQGSGFGDFQTLAGARLADVALSPYTNGGMLGRLNTPGNVNLGNLNPTPSSLIQPAQAQNLSNSINSLGRMHLVPLNSNQNPSLFQGIQSSLELDQLQQSEGAANFNSINNSRVFRNGGTVTGMGAALGNSNLPMLHGNAQPLLNGGGFGNQSAHVVASFTSESFNGSLLDPGKCNENWHNSVEVSKMHPNALFSAEPFPSQLLTPNGSRDNIPSNGPYVALPPFEDSRDMQCHQLGSWGDAHNMNQIPARGSLPNLDQNSRILNQMMNMNFDGSSSGSGSAHMPQDEGGKMATETVSDGDFLYEQPKPQDGFAPHGYDSMNELVHAIATINQGDGICVCCSSICLISLLLIITFTDNQFLY